MDLLEGCSVTDSLEGRRNTMDITHWDKIRLLEDRIEQNDFKPLVAFIKLLAEEKLLTRGMLHSMCECRLSDDDIHAAWRLLHEFSATYNCQVKTTHPEDHIFNIEFTCDKCRQVQHIKDIISDILSNIRHSGWPICPECGDDMDENVVEHQEQ